MESIADWVWLYKFGREVLIFAAFAGLVLHVYRPRNRERFEAPARRMLEGDEG